jgi:uncharacterized membrane protein YpjA
LYITLALIVRQTADDAASLLHQQALLGLLLKYGAVAVVVPALVVVCKGIREAQALILLKLLQVH